MGRLLILRHGQSTWNASGRWQGWTDTPLSEAGEAQAVKAGRALAGMGTVPDIVACSDLARARRTAQLLAGQLGYGGELMVDTGLREQDLGQWTGLTRDEIEARWPGELAARSAGALVPVPGGEPGAVFFARAVAAVRQVAALGTDLAVVVTHGGVLISIEQALGLAVPHWRHTNLSGWWLDAAPLPGDGPLLGDGPVPGDGHGPGDGPVPGSGEAGAGVVLRGLAPVDLLAPEGLLAPGAGARDAPSQRAGAQGVTGRA